MFRRIAVFVLGLVATFAAAISSRPVAQPASSDPPSPSGKRKMVSWVILADTYVDLSVDVVRQKLDEVYPGQFLPPRQKGNFVIAGPVPGQFAIMSNIPGAAGFFLLNNIPGPYTEFSSFAEAIADPSLRSRVEKQCCWLSVDLVHRNTTNEDAYRFIEQVLAKLASADAAFLVDPDGGATVPFDDRVRALFAKGAQIGVSP